MDDAEAENHPMCSIVLHSDHGINSSYAVVSARGHMVVQVYFFCGWSVSTENNYIADVFFKHFFPLSQATRLKKEQEALLVKQWELEKIEEERREVEKRRKKSEMG